MEKNYDAKLDLIENRLPELARYCIIHKLMSEMIEYQALPKITDNQLKYLKQEDISFFNEYIGTFLNLVTEENDNLNDSQKNRMEKIINGSIEPLFKQ